MIELNIYRWVDHHNEGFVLRPLKVDPWLISAWYGHELNIGGDNVEVVPCTKFLINGSHEWMSSELEYEEFDELINSARYPANERVEQNPMPDQELLNRLQEW